MVDEEQIKRLLNAIDDPAGMDEEVAWGRMTFPTKMFT